MSKLDGMCLAGHVVSSGATWCCNLPKGHTGPHDDGLGDEWEDAAPDNAADVPGDPWENADRDVVADALAFIQQCGLCDAGLPVKCTCPTGNYRLVMARLVAEVERLRVEVATRD
ncbi:hypothetical protein [Micromonospora sp. NPDC005299]|uniref:hypothetical protein n=1 Tax=Micromonospora sp. NPDC005299 TaxID=3364231 RepID=UPI0036BA62A0